MKRWTSLKLLALALSLLALYVTATSVTPYASIAPGLPTLQAAVTSWQQGQAKLSFDWHLQLRNAVLVLFSKAAWMILERRFQAKKSQSRRSTASRPASTVQLEALKGAPVPARIIEVPVTTCSVQALVPSVTVEAPVLTVSTAQVLVPTRTAQNSVPPRTAQAPVPTHTAQAPVPTRSTHQPAPVPMAPPVPTTPQPAPPAAWDELEQQVVADLQLALGGSPEPVKEAQLGRLRALARLNLKFSQMEALTPILDADRVVDFNTVDAMAAALPNEDVESVLAMPVFRDFTTVVNATAQPQAKKLAVATLLVLLRRTAAAPQAREELRATLTALVTAGTPWSTLNGRFYKKWDGLSGAVSAAIGGEEHLAGFKYANVVASAMLALLMSEGLVLGSAGDALQGLPGTPQLGPFPVCVCTCDVCQAQVGSSS